MYQQAIYAFVLVAVCTLALVVIHRLARRSLLSFRYTMGWSLLFVTGIVAVPTWLIVGSTRLDTVLSPTSLVLGLGLFLLVSISIQLSISISGAQSRLRILAEEVAKIQMKLRAFESDDTDR